MKKRNKLTDLEVLEQVFCGELGEDELTEHQSEKLRRIRHVHAFLIGFHSTTQVTKKMRQLFGISQSQVFRDIAMTEALFGSIRQSNKEYNRLRSEQMAMETYRIARENRDTRGMAAANRNFNEATGINIDDPDLPFEKLDPQPNIVVIPQEILGKMSAKLGTGIVRWEDNPPQRQIEGEYIDHEEIEKNGAEDTD